MVYARISEQVDPGRRLGRHLNHDPRSLRYLAPAADLSTLKSVRHQRMIPVLDQGDLGSCTGNAAQGCLGTQPFFATFLPRQPDRPDQNAEVAEDQAVALYSMATTLDDYPGSYKPDDTGSDGLSVAKACQQLGLISGYRHATSLEAALTALATQPVIAGINWYSSFDRPEYDYERALIFIDKTATIRGGHEICLDELDMEGGYVGFTNSWGPSWAAQGRAYMSFDVLARLLGEDGDVTVFTPLSQPAPVPTPPAPTDPLAELAAMFRQWVTSFDDWFKKHGF